MAPKRAARAPKKASKSAQKGCVTVVKDTVIKETPAKQRRTEGEAIPADAFFKEVPKPYLDENNKPTNLPSLPNANVVAWARKTGWKKGGAAEDNRPQADGTHLDADKSRALGESDELTKEGAGDRQAANKPQRGKGSKNKPAKRNATRKKEEEEPASSSDEEHESEASEDDNADDNEEAERNQPGAAAKLSRSRRAGAAAPVKEPPKASHKAAETHKTAKATKGKRGAASADAAPNKRSKSGEPAAAALAEPVPEEQVAKQTEKTVAAGNVGKKKETGKGGKKAAASAIPAETAPSGSHAAAEPSDKVCTASDPAESADGETVTTEQAAGSKSRKGGRNKGKSTKAAALEPPTAEPVVNTSLPAKIPDLSTLPTHQLPTYIVPPPVPAPPPKHPSTQELEQANTQDVVAQVAQAAACMVVDGSEPQLNNVQAAAAAPNDTEVPIKGRKGRGAAGAASKSTNAAGVTATEAAGKAGKGRKRKVEEEPLAAQEEEAEKIMFSPGGRKNERKRANKK